MAITWHNRNNQNIIDAPAIGTRVMGQRAAGAARPYKIYEIKNGTLQQQLVNDLNIVAWAYVDDILAQTAPDSSKLLSGYKEGVDNDWAPTVDGYIQLEYDIKMLRQQINARLQTLPNEVDGFDGIDYLNVIFGDTSVEQKAAVLADVIQNIPTVKSVTFINAVWINKKEGIFKFTFDIQSIFGELEFQFGIDTQNKTIINN